ncbi:MAG: hypothetical protein QM652_00620 [Legionella sp.]|uniref:hypothetical protein n=1 Tax=Legionella sp. TaxID=459 RepID=UPI0039E29D81
MRLKIFFYVLLISCNVSAVPRFVPAELPKNSYLQIHGAALCATAKETLAYLNKGNHYDPQVIHEGKIIKISLARVKSSLQFICQHQDELNNPDFIKQHFEFIRWYPDIQQTKKLGIHKPLIAHLPHDKILMTKYYVHKAYATSQRTTTHPYALYALPKDENYLTLEQADKKHQLIRFQYGKQAILNGALTFKGVPVLAYLSRDDLEAALLQGTVIANFMDKGRQTKTFNVHRCNYIPYDKNTSPYAQERYWYFKEVEGIKGYGKDADHKITVNSKVTFAADLEQFGLGKVLMVQYPEASGKLVTRAGILADTGGAFANNFYQVDFLTGSYAGKTAFSQASRHLPDYVTAYLMVLKK